MGLDITGLGSVADFAKGIMDKFIPDKMSDAEKAQVELGIQQAVMARDVARDTAQKDVIVAEMNQGDNYTKRARPTIVYAGLGFIFLVDIFAPILEALTGKKMPAMALPVEFWYTWGGVCSVWVWGRSKEKQGVAGKAIKAITGSIR